MELIMALVTVNLHRFWVSATEFESFLPRSLENENYCSSTQTTRTFRIKNSTSQISIPIYLVFFFEKNHIHHSSNLTCIQPFSFGLNGQSCMKTFFACFIVRTRSSFFKSFVRLSFSFLSTYSSINSVCAGLPTAHSNQARQKEKETCVRCGVAMRGGRRKRQQKTH